MGAYLDHYNRSIKERDAFWADEARLIDWKTPPTEICDFSKPPFAKWFGGGSKTSNRRRYHKDKWRVGI